MIARIGIMDSVSGAAAIPTPTWWINAQNVLTSGGFVTQATDLSGNGRHYVGIMSANYPGYAASVQNGKPAIVYGGGLKYLEGAALPISTDFAIYIVRDRVPTANPSEYVLGSSSSAGSGVLANITSGGRSFGHISFPGTIQICAATAASATNAVSIYKHVQGAVFRNGISQPLASSSALVNLSNIIRLGTIGTGSTYFSGNILEVIVYDRALTTAEDAAVYAYLNSQYAIF